MSRLAAKSTEISPAKREQILRGAREAFGQLGFERASVDLIAARAGCSKATIYNHFHDKKALFFACFAGEVQIRDSFVKQLDATPGEDVEGELRGLADALLRLVVSPTSIRRWRIIEAEVERFPELGQSLWTSGAQICQDKMAAWMERAGAAGLLRIEDPEDAAIDFSALVLGNLVRKLQIRVLRKASEEDLRHNVDRAVGTFLRAYRA
jgi:TetR/AcrR family transcriptional regulator, mexJK operon transcriptional repressor